MQQPNIVIVGAGAVGAYVGGNLIRAGYRVTLVDPWSEHVAAMRANGLTLQGLSEPECFQVPVTVMTPADYVDWAQKKPVDIGIIATKSYDTEWAARFILPQLAPDGYVVSLQNCLNEPAIAQIVGAQRTLGCIASTITVGLYEAGVVQRNVPRRGDSYTVFRCGEYALDLSDRARAFADMMRVVDSARATDNLIGERWTKLVINTSRNGILAATGIDTADMELEPGPRRLCIRAAAETIRVAQANQITLEPIDKFTADQWVAAADGDTTALDAIESNMQATAQTRVRGTQLSMGQDIDKGRRTEIDYLNGFVVQQGEKLGIATPANAAIWQAVRQVESGAMKQDRSNLDMG